MWILYALASAAFAALVAVFGKIGLKGVDSTTATAVRSVVMALFLIAVSLALGKFKNFDWGELSTRMGLFIALSGIAGAMSWLFYFFALQNGPAIGVVVVDKLSVVIVVILAACFLGEAFTWKTAAGTLLTLAGAVLMTWQ